MKQIEPYGWLTGDSTSHRQGSLEDLVGSEEWANQIINEYNAYERAQADGLDPDFEDRKPVAMYHERDVKPLIAEVESLRRKNLELTRVYEEQKLQEGRLEVALERAKSKKVELLIAEILNYQTMMEAFASDQDAETGEMMLKHQKQVFTFARELEK